MRMHTHLHIDCSKCTVRRCIPRGLCVRLCLFYLLVHVIFGIHWVLRCVELLCHTNPTMQERVSYARPFAYPSTDFYLCARARECSCYDLAKAYVHMPINIHRQRISSDSPRKRQWRSRRLNSLHTARPWTPWAQAQLLLWKLALPAFNKQSAWLRKYVQALLKVLLLSVDTLFDTTKCFATHKQAAITRILCAW